MNQNGNSNGFKLSYLSPLTPAIPQFVGPPIKMDCFDEDFCPTKREWQNIFLRIKKNRHTLEMGPIYQVIDNQTFVAKLPRDATSKNKYKNHQYKFTKIFGPNVEQDNLFRNACMSSMQNFIKGDNCLLFTYGATNSGKTYTIQGDVQNPGIIPRAINVLFNSIKGKISYQCKYKPERVVDVVWLDDSAQQEELKYKRTILGSSLDKSQCSRLYSSKSTLTVISEDSLERDKTCSSVNDDYVCNIFRDMQKYLNDTVTDVEDEGNIVFSVWVSYAEIYNECIFDLLEAPVRGQKRRQLSLGESQQNDVYIKGLRHICVFSGDEAYQVYQFGQHNLQMAPTNVNHVSSRSHGIFSMKLIKHLNTDSPAFARVSMFTLVDLAGAERAKKTHNRGERMKESQSINTSLHVLGKCLEVIRQNQRTNEKRMIPFRESKLTRLFQRSLCGKDNITMIVNVNLDNALYEETVNVLKFTAIARDIEYDSALAPKVCTLRSSRFSQFLSNTTLGGNSLSQSSLVQEGHPRYEELLSLLEAREQQITDLRQEMTKIQGQVRTELCKKFSDMFVKMETTYQNRWKKNEDKLEELAEWRVNSIKTYYEQHCKRHRTDSEDEEEEEDKDEMIQELENKNNGLVLKQEAMRELLEGSKQRCTELQQQNTKLQFNMAALKEELKQANRIVEASHLRTNFDRTEIDPVYKEMQVQLDACKKEVEVKNKELQIAKEIINDAKCDYEMHFKDHEDDGEIIHNLEKLVASKDEEIDELKSNVECCRDKLMQQSELLRQQDEDESQKNEKWQALCETRDEYMFKATNSEAACKRLQKENQDLRDAASNKSLDSTEIRAMEALVESVKDEMNQYIEKLKSSELVNKDLKSKLAEAENRPINVDQESLEKEITILQKEIKDLMGATKDLNTELKEKSEEVDNLNQKLKQSEGCLAQEQKNTKEIQKVLKNEKERLILQLKAVSDTSSDTQAVLADLEQTKELCEKLDEQNQALEERIQLQESEMENFKIRRDAQFKNYEDMLKVKQDEIDMQKREVRRYQEVFVKTPTPSKIEYRGKINRLKDEIMNKNEEIKKYQTQVSELERECDCLRRKSCLRENPKVSQLAKELNDLQLKPTIKQESKRQPKRTTRHTKVHSENDDPSQDCEVIKLHGIRRKWCLLVLYHTCHQILPHFCIPFFFPVILLYYLSNK